jgi:hypothetical protein
MEFSLGFPLPQIEKTREQDKPKLLVALRRCDTDLCPMLELIGQWLTWKSEPSSHLPPIPAPEYFVSNPGQGEQRSRRNESMLENFRQLVEVRMVPWRTRPSS